MGRSTIILDCTCLPAPDARQIHVLARLLLLARRHKYDLRLSNASDALLDLIAFAGLADVLRVEPRWQTDEWEQAPGVQEERELHNQPG